VRDVPLELVRRFLSEFRNNSYSGTGEPPVSFVLQQFSYLVAPPLISAGIVILGGLLFWHAAAWRSRRRRLAEDR
jgi:hypothetical protein